MWAFPGSSCPSSFLLPAGHEGSSLGPVLGVVWRSVLSQTQNERGESWAL